MARHPRLVIPQQPHHLIQRGNNRQAIFIDEADYAFFLRCLREGCREVKVAIHAYVLMPNHLHLLASPAEATGLSRLMQWIGRFYVPYFNRKYDRVGTLFQGRFKAIVVQSERYFLTCSRYIEQNPVRAGMVVHPANFTWSSYAHHVGLRIDPLLTDHAIYWALGNTPFQREAAYRELVDEIMSGTEVELVTIATQKGWPLVAQPFKTTLEKVAKRPLGPVKRGRPRKMPELAEATSNNLTGVT